MAKHVIPQRHHGAARFRLTLGKRHVIAQFEFAIEPLLQFVKFRS